MEDNGAECLFRSLANSLSGLETLYLVHHCPPIHKLSTHSVPLFQSVLRLTLKLPFEEAEADVMKILPCLLKSFPLLQNLNVGLPRFNPWSLKGYVLSDDLLIPYPHVNLKEVGFCGFGKSYIAFASYLLRSDVVLERMVISQAVKLYDGCREIFKPTCRFFTEEGSKYIRGALQGKAVSPNVVLIIPWQSIINGGIVVSYDN